MRKNAVVARRHRGPHRVDNENNTTCSSGETRWRKQHWRLRQNLMTEQDDFDLSSSVYHHWLVQNSKPILTTQAKREAWLLIFPSSGLRRGSSGSGLSSSAVGGSSRRRGSGASGRDRRARRAAAEDEPESEPEYAPQMEETDVQFDIGSYPRMQGQPSWEAAIEHTVVGHGMSGQVWRGQQPWSYVRGNFGNCYVPQFVVSEPQFFDPQPVDVDYMTSVMDTTSLSSPLVSTGVGGAGPSMFRTPRRMNVESEEDNDDKESGQVRGGVADDDDDDDDNDDDDDGERGAEARVRNPPRRYDDTGSLHRQTLTCKRRGPRN
ncbi:hypothetical protein V6N12_062761 [Hibiscus sabdariffa]|uniref:Uncharacterized protein n=1 Tax=Hibiscus sabdariffa TaxID=183260 RepID=A0ABR2F9S7_9ROSI